MYLGYNLYWMEQRCTPENAKTSDAKNWILFILYKNVLYIHKKKTLKCLPAKYFIGVNIVIFSIAVAKQFMRLFSCFGAQCHFQSYFYQTRDTAPHHYRRARALPLPLSCSNPIRHLFSNFIVKWQLKTVKNLAIMIFWGIFVSVLYKLLSHFVRIVLN